MKKIMSTALASLLVVTSAMGTVANAAHRDHRHGDRERFVSNYCDNHKWDRDCRNWRDHRQSWNNDRYDRWYRDHHHEFGAGDAAAAIFGFAAGALGAAAASADDAGHVARCEDRYDSYNRRTDQYFGYDGRYHYCRL